MCRWPLALEERVPRLREATTPLESVPTTVCIKQKKKLVEV